MFNANAFKAALALAGHNQKTLCEEIGMAEGTLVRKMKTGIFRSDEIERICLALSMPDPVPVFFYPESSLEATKGARRDA